MTTSPRRRQAVLYSGMRRTVRFARLLLSLLLLIGLGSSVREGAGCDEKLEAQGSQITSADWGHPAVPDSRGAHCCPCIHTYPGSFTVSTVARPVMLGYSVRFAVVPSFAPERSPEPLVPPPIV